MTMSRYKTKGLNELSPEFYDYLCGGYHLDYENLDDLARAVKLWFELLSKLDKSILNVAREDLSQCKNIEQFMYNLFQSMDSLDESGDETLLDASEATLAFDVQEAHRLLKIFHWRVFVDADKSFPKLRQLIHHKFFDEVHSDRRLKQIARASRPRNTGKQLESLVQRVARKEGHQRLAGKDLINKMSSKEYMKDVLQAAGINPEYYSLGRFKSEKTNEEVDGIRFRVAGDASDTTGAWTTVRSIYSRLIAKARGS